MLKAGDIVALPILGGPQQLITVVEVLDNDRPSPVSSSSSATLRGLQLRIVRSVVL